MYPTAPRWSTMSVAAKGRCAVRVISATPSAGQAVTGPDTVAQTVQSATVPVRWAWMLRPSSAATKPNMLNGLVDIRMGFLVGDVAGSPLRGRLPC